MTPPGRVLVIGGLAESLVNFRGDLLKAMLARGLAVHAAAPDLQGSRVGETLTEWGVVPHPISLRRTGLNPVQDLVALLDLWRLFRQIRPTHLLAYTVKPVIYGLLAARLARVPHPVALITGLGYAFTARPTGSRHQLVQSLVLQLYRAALRGAERVVFQNPDDRALFVELGLVEPDRCAVIAGSGIHLETFAVAPLPPLAPSIHFLMIARLLRDKGIYEFVDAARAVRQRHPGAQFHVAGWYDTNPTAISPSELESWVADGSIVYHGRLEDVRPLIAQCHVYVLPSYREGTPRTVLEAMAMGRAIVTTDVPGCRETVQDGRNGYLVPARDARGLADALLRLIENPGELARMGATSRELAAQKYDVRKVNAQLLAHMGL